MTSAAPATTTIPVTVFNTQFELTTPQAFLGETVYIQGSAGNIYADFYFVHSQEGRVNVASFNSITEELKENISGIVKLVH